MTHRRHGPSHTVVVRHTLLHTIVVRRTPSWFVTHYRTPSWSVTHYRTPSWSVARRHGPSHAAMVRCTSSWSAAVCRTHCRAPSHTILVRHTPPWSVARRRGSSHAIARHYGLLHAVIVRRTPSRSVAHHRGPSHAVAVRRAAVRGRSGAWWVPAGARLSSIMDSGSLVVDRRPIASDRRWISEKPERTRSNRFRWFPSFCCFPRSTYFLHSTRFSDVFKRDPVGRPSCCRRLWTVTNWPPLYSVYLRCSRY